MDLNQIMNWLQENPAVFIGIGVLHFIGGSLIAYAQRNNQNFFSSRTRAMLQLLLWPAVVAYNALGQQNNLFREQQGQDESQDINRYDNRIDDFLAIRIKADGNETHLFEIVNDNTPEALIDAVHRIARAHPVLSRSGLGTNIEIRLDRLDTSGDGN